jgi:hypothetical protein
MKVPKILMHIYRGFIVTMATRVDLIAARRSNLASPSVMLAPKEEKQKQTKNPLRKNNKKQNALNFKIKENGACGFVVCVPVAHLPKTNAFIG